MRKSNFLLALAVAVNLHAAAITFVPTEETGGETANLEVTFDDSVNPGFITGNVSVLPDIFNPNVGDIRGVYFSLVGLPVGVTSAEILAAITGTDITGTALGVQLPGDAGLEPLGPFDIGLDIGSPGIGADDIQSTTFLINLGLIDPDITLANFGSVGVRVTSIGTGNNRNGSGKFFSDTPEDGGGGPSEVPEPSTYALVAGAFAVTLTYRRFARQ